MRRSDPPSRNAPPFPLEGVFDRLIDPTVLDAAWHRVRRNAGGPGGDGVTLGRFAVDAGERLARYPPPVDRGRI
jgi:hypothetical protein